MKINKKEPARDLRIASDAEGFLITESVRYLPNGYTNRKWDRATIWIDAEELKKALAFAEKSK